jgi:hypothetical protein
MFTEAYYAHITFDLSDASINQQRLAAPWVKLWRRYRGFYLRSLVSRTAVHTPSLSFVWSVSKCRLLCAVDDYDPPTAVHWVGQSTLIRAIKQPFYMQEKIAPISERPNRAEQLNHGHGLRS